MKNYNKFFYIFAVVFTASIYKGDDVSKQIDLINQANIKPKSNKEDLSHYFSLEQEYLEMGYSERAAKILSTNNPKQTISIEDTLNETERNKMYESLEQRKLLGYYEISKHEFDDIYNAEKNIHDTSKKYKNLSFTPSNLPEILENDYNYVGCSYDYNFKFYPFNSKSHTLRRILKNNAGTTIILDENYISNGETHSTEEFITHRIRGYPATIEKIKTANENKEAYQLIVGTEKYDYAIYLIQIKMSLDEATEELLTIGKQLIKLNTVDENNIH